jgi:hypothetical protein
MSPRDPKRLRLTASSALQRRALEESAHEEPSPELRDRMARALGVSAAAVASSAALAKTAVSAPASAKIAVGASASTTPVLPWIAVGVLGLALAGAIVGTQAWKTSPSVQPAPAVNASATESAAKSFPTAPMPSLAAQPASSALASQRPESAAMPAGRRLRTSPSPAAVQEQTTLVDAARDAVARGAADKALALLRQYQDKFPGGVFRPEAAALKIEALARLGRGAEVHALANRFVAEYGDGPLTDRVRRAAGSTSR